MDTSIFNSYYHSIDLRLRQIYACDTPELWHELLCGVSGPECVEPPKSILHNLRPVVFSSEDDALIGLFHATQKHVDTVLTERRIYDGQRDTYHADLKQLDEPFHLAGYRPYAYEVPTIDLSIELRKQGLFVENLMHIKPKPGVLGEPLLLRGQNIELTKLRLNGSEVKRSCYEVTEHGIILHELPQDCEEYVLQIETRVADTSSLKRGKHLYSSPITRDPLRHLTFSPARPDVLSRYSCALTMDQRFNCALASGNCLEDKLLDDGRRCVRFSDTHSKASHHFSFAIGQLECTERELTTELGQKVTIQVYTKPDQGEHALLTIKMLKHALQWDAQQFGSICDRDIFRIVALPDLKWQASGDLGCLLMDESRALWARDGARPHWEMQNAVRNILSQYAHQRFGVRASIRDWSQLAWQEGLTEYFEECALAALPYCEGMRLEPEHVLRRAIALAFDNSSHSHALRLEKWRTLDEHNRLLMEYKSPEIMRMLHDLVGDTAWRCGIRRFSCLYDERTPTIDDFLSCMEWASGRSLKQFALWFDESGAPRVTMKLKHDAKTQSVRVTFQQKWKRGSNGEPLYAQIPIRFALFDTQGNKVALHGAGSAGATEQVLELTEKSHTFTFHGITEAPTPSLFRGLMGGPQVDLSYNSLTRNGYRYSRKQLLMLAEHDDDLVNRYAAFRQLIQQEIRRARFLVAYRLPSDIQKLLTDTLHDQTLSASTKAYLMGLPESVMQASGNEVPGRHSMQRGVQRFGAAVANALLNELQEIQEGLSEKNHCNPKLKAAGEGELQLVCLRYLAQLGPEMRGYILRLFRTVHTHSERATILEASPKAIRNELLEAMREEARNRKDTALAEELPILEKRHRELKQREEPMAARWASVPLIGLIAGRIGQARRFRRIARQELP